MIALILAGVGLALAAAALLGLGISRLYPFDDLNVADVSDHASTTWMAHRARPVPCICPECRAVRDHLKQTGGTR